MECQVRVVYQAQLPELDRASQIARQSLTIQQATRVLEALPGRLDIKRHSPLVF